MRFRHQPLSSPRAYRRYFGCDVFFEQSEDGLVFPERDLRCPIVEPDASHAVGLVAGPRVPHTPLVSALLDEAMALASDFRGRA